MQSHICKTCGTQFAPALQPQNSCPVCDDERQYVGWSGQQWTTHEELLGSHSVQVGEDAGLLAFAMQGDFGIPQRSLLLPTEAGNILWECLSLVTDEAVRALRARGGVDRIIISHPHFYASMVQWSDALGGVPILLHGDDKNWVRRSTSRIEFWNGDRFSLGSGVTLVRTGGIFLAVLHCTGQQVRAAGVRSS